MIMMGILKPLLLALVLTFCLHQSTSLSFIGSGRRTTITALSAAGNGWKGASSSSSYEGGGGSASSARAAAAAAGAASSAAAETTTEVGKKDNNAGALSEDDKSDSWIVDSFESSPGVLPQDDEDEEKEAAVVGPGRCLIYDTSLRDGTQMESINVSCDDKLKIVQRLSAFNIIDYIECGWPGSNPKDAEFFHRAKTELDASTRTKLVAFGSTKRKSVKEAGDDPQIQALIESETDTVCIVAKGHLWQVTDILRATGEENLHMIRDSVSYLVGEGRRVFVDLEHFFDGYKFNPKYSMECINAAAEAGASGLVLCDTNGGSMPWEVDEITRHVTDVVGGETSGITIGIHTHNDCGMASANSIVAVKAGAGLVQGTMNGIGERTGNADLCTVIPCLALHVKSNITSAAENLNGLTSLSRFVDEIMNRSPNTGAPFVGMSAFAHKGGLHVAALERSPDSYQHIDPGLVGNEKRVLISELSGRQNVLGKITEAGVDFGDQTSERATAILNHVKKLESKGFTFEGADASVHLMILHATEGYCSPFRVLDYSAQVFDTYIDSGSRVVKKMKGGSGGLMHANGATARATIKVRMINTDDAISNEPYIDRLEVSDGNGPVDALTSALMRALIPLHPSLKSVELVDYKVRILDPESATGAATRVMIEFRDTEQDTTWSTVSVDRNVISASLNALVDGFEYALIEHASACMLCDDEDEYFG